MDRYDEAITDYQTNFDNSNQMGLDRYLIPSLGNMPGTNISWRGFIVKWQRLSPRKEKIAPNTWSGLRVFAAAKTRVKNQDKDRSSWRMMSWPMFAC